MVQFEYASPEPAETWFKKLRLTVQNELIRIELSKLNWWRRKRSLGRSGTDGGGRTCVGKPDGS